MTGTDMRLAPAFALALVPLAAGALTANVNGSTADVLVGANNCRTLQLTLNWDIQTTPSTVDHLRAMGARNQASCTTNPPSPSPELPIADQSPAASQTGSATKSASALAYGADAGTPSCDNA